MTIDDKIRNVKFQYINREAAKISLDKIDKYEYLAGEEILPRGKKKTNKIS